MTVYIHRKRHKPILIDRVTIMDPELSHGALRLYLLFMYEAENSERLDKCTILGASPVELAGWTRELNGLGYIIEDQDDVVVCYPHEPDDDARLSTARCTVESPAPTEPEYVYLVKSGKYYKIGKATDVETRVKQLGTMPPFGIELIHTIASESPYELEAELHDRFADRRVSGEWFVLEPEDVELIMSYDGNANEADDE